MSKNVGVSVKCAVFKRCAHGVWEREVESQRAVVKILVINVENHKSSPGFCEHNKATEEVLVPYTISHWYRFDQLALISGQARGNIHQKKFVKVDSFILALNVQYVDISAFVKKIIFIQNFD